MTKIAMRFVTTTNIPIGDALVQVRLTRSDADEKTSGVVINRMEEFHTDATGEVIVDLVASESLYHVTAYDTVQDIAIHHDFYVPKTDNPNTVLRLQDLIVPADTVLSSLPYDKEALLEILRAKAEALAAAKRAEDAALASEGVIDAVNAAVETAEGIRDRVLAAETVVKADAVEVRAAVVMTAGYKNEAQQSKVAAKASEVAAEAAKQEAIVRANDAHLSSDKAKVSELASEASAVRSEAAKASAQEASAIAVANAAAVVADRNTVSTLASQVVANAAVVNTNTQATTDAAADALSYKNAAEAASTTSSTQAGIATDKAAEAAQSADAAKISENKTALDSISAATSATTATTAKDQTVAAKDITIAAKDATVDAKNVTLQKAAELASQLVAFNEIYIGKFAQNPTVDGNGNPLKVGAIYENTTEGKLYQYESDLQWHPYDEESQQQMNNATLSASSAAASAGSATVSMNAAEAARAVAVSAKTGAESARDAAILSADVASAAVALAEASKNTAVSAADTASQKAVDAAASAARAEAAAENATSGQVQADWSVSDNTSKAFIKNKPVLAAVATSGLKSDIGLGNVNNTADVDKPVSSPQATALALKAPIANPTFTGTVSGVTKGMVGLGNVDNTSDAAKPVSAAQAAALALKAPAANPVFTGTVSGVSKDMVGLTNVDNTSDASKPVSTAQATAIALKAPVNNPAFTGTVTGVTKTMVGLGNVDNTADVDKPVSTATTTALTAKQSTSEKDASGGYVGKTAHSINMKDATGAYTSFLANANTAARTYTFPDKSGTVAMLSDITGGGGGNAQATGDVIFSVRKLASPDWLLCDGSTQLRVNYPNLWKLLPADLVLNNVTDVAISTIAPSTVLSDDGTYMAVGVIEDAGSSIPAYVTVQQKAISTGSWAPKNFMTFAETPSRLSGTPSMNMLAIGHGTNLSIYNNTTTNSPVKITPFTYTGGGSSMPKFSPDGSIFFVPSNTTAGFTLYSVAGTTFTPWAPSANASVAYTQITDSAFSADNKYLIVTLNAAPYVDVFKINGTTLTKQVTPLAAVTSSPLAVVVDSVCNRVVVLTSVSPYVRIFTRSGDVFSNDVVLNPALPNNAHAAIAMSESGEYLVISSVTPKALLLYRNTSKTEYTTSTQSITQPELTVYGLAMSRAAERISVVGSRSDSTTSISAYDRTATSMNEFKVPTLALGVNAYIKT